MTIDGHDIGNLVKTFNAAHKLKRPVLVHVVTTKGKGVTHMQKQIRLDIMHNLHLILQLGNLFHQRNLNLLAIVKYLVKPY